jgi:hypothetical protein
LAGGCFHRVATRGVAVADGVVWFEIAPKRISAPPEVDGIVTRSTLAAFVGSEPSRGQAMDDPGLLLVRVSMKGVSWKLR